MKIFMHTMSKLLIFIFMLVGCGQNSNSITQQSMSSLIILRGAENINKKEIDGSIQVFYSLHEKYPASKTIEMIEKQLHSKGWAQLKYNELNLNSPTSLVTGWTIIPNPTKDPGDEVHFWNTVWKNGAGDYLKYDFQYFSPKERIKEQKLVFVAAIFVPSKRAKEVKIKMNEILDNNKRDL